MSAIPKYVPSHKSPTPWWRQRLLYLYAIVTIAIICGLIIILEAFYYGHKWLTSSKSKNF